MSSVPSRAPALHHPQRPGMPLRIKKRIIVCCDGTWQDGIVVKECWKYTNVLKLARSINQYDERTSNYAIPQAVFYQTGIGSSEDLYSEYVHGVTGGSLGNKVHEAYAFICQNYCPGDEIFLFGFSRGACTARMIAMFIGAIGVLDKTDMDHFADLFHAYQRLDKSHDPAEIERLHAYLAPWTSSTSRGRLRAISDDIIFSVKCVGVFDTVSAIGMPEELSLRSSRSKLLYGFSNTQLGEHVERAYQALAVHETRADFNCDKFEQTQGGLRKGQVLKQCWFAVFAEDSKIGGGFRDHDLSDLTLIWMVANIEDILSVDLDYIRSHLDPVAPWGMQLPHNARTGIFALTGENTRQLPVGTDHITHETIHPSVLEQDHAMNSRVQKCVRGCSSLMWSLLPLEEEMRRSWPYVLGNNDPANSRLPEVESTTVVEADVLRNVTKDILSIGTQSGTEIIKEIRTRVAASKNTNGVLGRQSSSTVVTSLLANLANESHAGAEAIMKEIAKHRKL